MFTSPALVREKNAGLAARGTGRNIVNISYNKQFTCQEAIWVANSWFTEHKLNVILKSFDLQWYSK